MKDASCYRYSCFTVSIECFADRKGLYAKMRIFGAFCKIGEREVL